MTKTSQEPPAQEEPDYLINQSTHTCLAVLGGTCPDDAVLGMAECSGARSQQWYATGDGQWQWGGNRAYCLVSHPDTLRVELGYSNSAEGSTCWVHDDADRLVDGELVLDVPWESPRTAVGLWPKHEGSNQKWWTLSTLKAHLNVAEEPINGMIIDILGPQWQDTIQKFNRRSSETSQTTESSCEEEAEPDVFINQSSLTCLAVTSGSSPLDAVVGLESYTGSPRQRWFLKDKRLLWGGDLAYCLEVDLEKFSIRLAECAASSVEWTLDESGVLSTGTHALDVPWKIPRTKAIMWPKNGRENQRWWKLSKLCDSIGHCLYPFPPSSLTLYKKETAREIINRLTPVTEPLPYPRDVQTFPGAVDAATPRLRKTLLLDLSTLGQRKNLRMTVPQDWQATDLYVVPGEVFQVILPDDLPPEQADQVKVRVGAHCDCLDLHSTNVSDQRKFKRMPVVTDVFEVFPGINSLRSQFGGSLIFMFEEGDNFVTKVEVQNVIAAPYYRLGTTSDKIWNRSKYLHAPSSVLESGRFVFVIPTTAASKITDPQKLMQRYDRVMEKMDDLCGFGDTDPPPRGKYWLVEDVQISCGSAHAGFPVMFDRQYYDLTSLDTPHHWVISHEMGHNYQQGPYWSNVYGSESTVNLFSVFVEEELNTGNRLKKQNDYLKAAKAVDEGMKFEEADCWQKLVFLMEIKHAFPEPGWEMFRHLNRTTRALREEEAQHIVSDSQHQFDYVYKVLSKRIGRDLILTYKRWGIDISQEAQDEIQQLELKKAPGDLSH
ncbi:hypothetical protein C7M84_018890 [Penaeus vannamei]|uniref:Peptidase M60 domain-containing protein n=1 Tax=Penaeus vannamei TaxID=6689 RepID=A0A3R7QCF5_PENVA|nr:uncharacterized protein LOC113823864 [Penaeus vannamei]ROT63236.1 hypothetical protein C7M84_018890 [Penaeus vannamei]